MTESEWLAGKDLAVMGRFLEGKISARKLRLFVVACCRRIPRLMREELCRRAIEVAERFADGAASRRELEKTHQTVVREAIQGVGWSAQRAVWLLASYCVDPHFTSYRVNDVSLARPFAVLSRREENRLQISLLKDIVGNPFRVALFDGSWLTWNDGTVTRIAKAIYNDRAFDRLPILADALEEADCDNSDILHPFRQSGEHVRGCWMIDLLLGKS